MTLLMDLQSGARTVVLRTDVRLDETSVIHVQEESTSGEHSVRNVSQYLVVGRGSK
jgi:hypothetical protein